jgi:hypothetical protein
MPETVAQFRELLARGSSFPSLVETSSGRLMVLKLAGAGQGPRGLAAEFIASSLAQAAGLRTPHVEPLLLPAGLPWEIGTDEFHEAVQRSVGWNLGIAFVSGATDLEATDVTALPADFVGRLAAVDALLQNVDRTRKNLNLLRDLIGAPWAIDFGACLLTERLARGAAAPRIELPINHVLAGRGPFTISPQAIASDLTEGRLDDILARIPDEWLADLGLRAVEIGDRLKDYVQRIRALR